MRSSASTIPSVTGASCSASERFSLDNHRALAARAARRLGDDPRFQVEGSRGASAHLTHEVAPGQGRSIRRRPRQKPRVAGALLDELVVVHAPLAVTAKAGRAHELTVQAHEGVAPPERAHVAHAQPAAIVRLRLGDQVGDVVGVMAKQRQCLIQVAPAHDPPCLADVRHRQAGVVDQLDVTVQRPELVLTGGARVSRGQSDSFGTDGRRVVWRPAPQAGAPRSEDARHDRAPREAVGADYRSQHSGAQPRPRTRAPMSPTSPLNVNDAAASSPLTARRRPAALAPMNEQNTPAQPHGEHGNAPAGSRTTPSSP